jgi:hypothetical protein
MTDILNEPDVFPYQQKTTSTLLAKINYGSYCW